MTNPTGLRVVVVGCTPLARHAIATIETLSGVEIVGVVNLHPSVAQGKSNHDPLTEFCKRRPRDVHLTVDINAAETIAWIADRAADVIVQCGWSQIFREQLLATPRLFCIGIHPSPLPVGRGAAVINWKLIEGGGAWGNSLFVMERGIDTGDVLDFEPFELEPRDDARTAYQKVDRTAVRMLARTLPKIADGTYQRTKQDDTQASVYRRRTPDDGCIDVCWPAQRLIDFVRALTHPYPGAYLETPSGRLVLWNASMGPSSTEAHPGTLLRCIPGRGVLIQCGQAESVWLERVSAPQDLEQWADEWAAENQLIPGDRIVTGSGLEFYCRKGSS